MQNFENLNIPIWLQKILDQLSITTPTPIQSSGLPVTLKGDNLLANAMTGTGKTMLYLLPIMSSLYKNPTGVHSLIISPSRELARSLEEQFSIFANKINCRVSVITGGQPVLAQMDQLNNIPHIVICTPGRMADLIVRNPQGLKFFKNLKMLVLDEFDRLIDPTLLFFVQQIMKYFFDVDKTSKKSNIS
jgi:ATP-dependent RNA helicase DDX49/DBP8